MFFCKTVDGIESWTDPMYITYITICGVLLIAFLVLINQREAQAVDEQYELAYKQHLVDGHVEVSELTRALARQRMMKPEREQASVEQQEKFLR